MNSWKRSIAGVAAAALCAPGLAQNYPTKPIRMILALGGGAEVVARLVAERAGQALGQPMVVESQSGAGGVLGAETVARAAPDGHTILLASTSSQIMRPFLSKATPYDPIKDFTPLTRVSETILLIVSNSAFAANSLKDVIDYARRNPGKLSYGTSGIGTQHHLSAELIKLVTGVDMVHIPYKGGNQVLTDLVSGQIPIGFTILATTAPLLSTGKLKILAVNNGKRYHVIPNVPTAGEQIPGYEPPPGWMGYFGPAGLAQPLVRRLHGEIVKVLNAPDVRAKSEEIGFILQPNTPEEFALEIRRDIAAVAKIVKAAGIQPE